MERQFVPVIHAATTDRADEVDTLTTAAAICETLKRGGYVSEVVDLGAQVDGLARLVPQSPTAVFNLVEAIDGQAARAIEAVRKLEALQLPLTGAGEMAYANSTSKLASKAVLQRAGLPAPRYWLASGVPPPADETVIVKSVDEHGSFGIDQASVVSGRSALAEIANRQEAYGGQFFAETYIDGREFNVSILESPDGLRVLPIAEISFDDLPARHLPIVDFAAKWDVHAPSYHLTPRRFGLEDSDPKLAVEIARLTCVCWAAFGLTGYARVDIRLDATGCPLILEVNANPCLAPDAGFAAAASRAGLSYDALIATIVTSAVRRGAMVPESTP